MARYREIREVEAYQWKEATPDHPEVVANAVSASKCAKCGHDMGAHGWLQIPRKDNTSVIVSTAMVCPGDWIVTDDNMRVWSDVSFKNRFKKV